MEKLTENVAEMMGRVIDRLNQEGKFAEASALEAELLTALCAMES